MSPFDSLRFRYHRWRVLRDAEAGLSPVTQVERAQHANLQAHFRRLPVQPTTGLSATETDWNGAMNRLRHLGSRADPRAFQRWDVIVARMAHIDSPATAPALEALQAHAEWESRWRPALEEVSVGRPHLWRGYPASSEVLIQTVYHVMRLERLSERKVAGWDAVVEFGGGFGGLCRVMHRLGFRGRYLIYDLPSFTLLQHYYLGSTGVLDEAHGRVEATSDFGVLEAFVETLRPEHHSAFWATWSLSETPIALRERIKPLVAHIGNYCVGYQGRYGEVDNTDYFVNHWLAGPSRTERIAHRGDDYYLAGSSE